MAAIALTVVLGLLDVLPSGMQTIWHHLALRPGNVRGRRAPAADSAAGAPARPYLRPGVFLGAESNGSSEKS